MADKVQTISAAQLPADIQTAVKAATGKNHLLKDAAVAGLGAYPPWIMGFVMPNAGDRSLDELQGAAHAVAAELPAAKGKTPAVAGWGGHIILGYYPEPEIQKK
jgi:hypothetical protein